jgi:RNA-directed DNA polymerase
MLSNLACIGLDERLSALARSARLAYTRYSDDLTFSGPPGTFDRKNAIGVVDRVREILRSHGFRMHEKKISIVPPGGRKVVLGLLVDRERPRLPGELRRRLADHVRGVEGFGIAGHAVERNFEAPTGMVNHIAGLLRFARDVEPEFADPLRARFEAALVRHGWGAGP